MKIFVKKKKEFLLFYSVFNNVLLLFCLPLGFCLESDYGFLSLIDFYSLRIFFRNSKRTSLLRSTEVRVIRITVLTNGRAGPGLLVHECCRSVSPLKVVLREAQSHRDVATASPWRCSSYTHQRLGVCASSLLRSALKASLVFLVMSDLLLLSSVIGALEPHSFGEASSSICLREARPWLAWY